MGDPHGGIIYIPRPWHHIFPVSLLTIGLYIGHNYEHTFDIVLVVLMFYFHAGMLVYYIVVAGIIYQKYLAKIDENEKPYGPIVPLNIGEQSRDLVFKQVMTAPKFANERYFAFTILRQYEHGFEVKLTESYWIKEKHWRGSRDEFVTMLDKWKARGIIKRAGTRKNSSYSIQQWEAVKLITSGNPLP